MDSATHGSEHGGAERSGLEKFRPFDVDIQYIGQILHHPVIGIRIASPLRPLRFGFRKSPVLWAKLRQTF